MGIYSDQNTYGPSSKYNLRYHHRVFYKDSNHLFLLLNQSGRVPYIIRLANSNFDQDAGIQCTANHMDLL